MNEIFNNNWGCRSCDIYMENKMNDNKCVMCGDIIPEGRQVCPKCENTVIKNEVTSNGITTSEKQP